MSISVLLVDDSRMVRQLLRRQLDRHSDIEIIGEAGDAREARQLIKRLNPDVITLDIEMPGMNGLDFLAKIMELRPTPVIIVSGATEPGAEATAKAMQLGAVNCYAKSTRHRSLADYDHGKLASLVREAASSSIGALRDRSHDNAPIEASAKPAPGYDSASRDVGPFTPPSVIAIGSSTGGVEALHELLAGFPEDCPPTVIVQHINACFADAIASALDNTAKPKVRIAESDLPLKRGEILLAPGGERHLMVAKGANGFRAALRAGDPVSGHRPSVDSLFYSVAKVAGAKSLGVLLTGMGQDGANGLLQMSHAGAATIAQDETTSVVFGMPRAAIALGAAGFVLPLDRIADTIFQSQEIAA